MRFLAERQSFYCSFFLHILCAFIAIVAETSVLTTSPEAFELSLRGALEITSFALSDPFSLVAFELPLLRLGALELTYIAHIRGTRARYIALKGGAGA